MRYTERELFDFMAACEAGKQVIITLKDGRALTGKCWAESQTSNEDEYGIKEPSLDVGPGTEVYSSDIEHIEIIG